MKANTKKYNKLKLPECWEIDIAQSFEEIQGFRDIWEKMQQEENKPSIDADIDRYISVTNTIKSNSQPYVIILKYKGKPAAMVIAKIERRSIDIKLGYKTIIKPKLKCLTVSYSGIIGKPNDEARSLIMNILMGFLRDKTVSVIYFNHLEKDSLIYNLSRQIPGFLSRSYFLENEKHWVMSVPESIEQFFQSFLNIRIFDYLFYGYNN